MSNMAFHGDAASAFVGKYWGTKIRDENGTLKDTGVQEFVEELLRTLTSLGPIELHRPIEFINHTNGPAIKIFNDGQNDWHGIRLRDKEGNEAQFGIGLGSEGINANSFIPHPKYSIDPDDQHRFYSELGGNAGTDREHNKAIEANNGLIGYQYLINNFQVPFWNWFKQPQFHAEDCATYYTWNLAGSDVILPTFVPQPKIRLGRVIGVSINRGETGTVSELHGTQGSEIVFDPAIEWTVFNRQFGCIEVGDDVTFTCIGEGYEILSAPEKIFFQRGTTVNEIAAGASGVVSVGDAEQVTALNPFETLTCDVEVAIVRDTSSGCGSWTIVAWECWDEDRCV